MGISLFVSIKVMLGMLFAMSGFPKIYKFRQFSEGMEEYKILKNPYLIQGMAILFIATEIFISLSLLSGFFVKYALISALILLMIYGSAVSINLFKKNHIDCHCFESFGSSSLTFATLLRIFLFLMMVTFGVYYSFFSETKAITSINYFEVAHYSFLIAAILFTNEIIQKGLVQYRDVSKEYEK